MRFFDRSKVCFGSRGDGRDRLRIFPWQRTVMNRTSATCQKKTRSSNGCHISAAEWLCLGKGIGGASRPTGAGGREIYRHQYFLQVSPTENRCKLSGRASLHRHWHSYEDEFVTIISGELVLIIDEDKTIIRAGDHAAFAAGVPHAHHLVNRSWGPGVFLAVGSRNHTDVATYPDVDLRYEQASNAYLHTDGTPYPKRDA